MLEVFSFLLIFTGSHSQELALNLRGYFGFRFFTNAKIVRTSANVRSGLNVLHKGLYTSLLGAWVKCYGLYPDAPLL